MKWWSGQLAVAGRVFVPVQFFAQGVVITPALRVQEGDAVGRAFDDDLVAMHQAGKGLHVEIDADVAPLTICTTMRLVSAMTMGRFDSAWGAIGTSTMPPRVGCSSGPPAERA